MIVKIAMTTIEISLIVKMACFGSSPHFLSKYACTAYSIECVKITIYRKKLKENSEKPHEHQDFYEEPVFEKPRAQKEELRCPYCGAPVHESDAKCEYCGSRL